MDEQDNMLREVADRLDSLPICVLSPRTPPHLRCMSLDGFSTSRVPDGPEVVASGSTVSMTDCGSKRVLPVDVSEAGRGEFAQLTRCFQFTKGLPDGQYVEILSSESNNRPANYVGLAVVTVNQMVWDSPCWYLSQGQEVSQS